MAKLILSHPTGNEFSRAAAMAFLDAGILDTFYTSVANMPGSIMHTLSSFKAFAELKRRSFNQQLSSKIKTHPYKEMGRLLSSKLGIKKLTEHETGYFSVDAVYHYLDCYVAKQVNKINNTDAVYCYEDGAYYTFNQAKKKRNAMHL